MNHLDNPMCFQNIAVFSWNTEQDLIVNAQWWHLVDENQRSSDNNAL